MPSSNRKKSVTPKEQHNNELLIKSQKDRFDYKYIELDNGMKAMLVSDPTYKQLKSSTAQRKDEPKSDSKKKSSKRKNSKRSTADEKLSAVALCIRSGSFSNPKEAQGLAHLVEHLLSTGSNKFPGDDALDDYLNKGGGYHEAYTEYEYTILRTEVLRKYVYGVLNRLAQCLIEPELRPESVEREINAINAEFLSNNHDFARCEQILNNLANRGHPFNMFAWGNQESLKTIPQKSGKNVNHLVKEFMAKHYTPDNIHLVVRSQHSLEQLEKWVKKFFGSIKRRQVVARVGAHQWGLPFDGNTHFNKLYLVDSINKKNRLIILWCLPPVVDHFETSPLRYWSRLIEYDGKGSLVSRLKKDKLAQWMKLKANKIDNGFFSNRYSSMLVIQVGLTSKGSRDLHTVVDYIFEYLQMLRELGPLEWFYNELRVIEDNQFELMEEVRAFKQVRNIAVNMCYLPVKYALRGNRLFKKFDRDLIQSFIDRMTPQNACFLRLNSDIIKSLDEHKTREKWFETKYKAMDVPEQWLTHRVYDPNHYSFPEPNTFVATNTTNEPKNSDQQIK